MQPRRHNLGVPRRSTHTDREIGVVRRTTIGPENGYYTVNFGEYGVMAAYLQKDQCVQQWTSVADAQQLMNELLIQDSLEECLN